MHNRYVFTGEPGPAGTTAWTQAPFWQGMPKDVRGGAVGPSGLVPSG